MLHIRFNDEIARKVHSSITIFLNGKNIGTLKMDPAEAIWLNHILQKGCAYLDSKFVASGKGPDASNEKIDNCAIALSKK